MVWHKFLKHWVNLKIQFSFLNMKGTSQEESTWKTQSSAPRKMETLIRGFNLKFVIKLNNKSGISKITIAGLSNAVTTAVYIIVGVAITVRRSLQQKCKYISFEESSVNLILYQLNHTFKLRKLWISSNRLNSFTNICPSEISSYIM